MTVKTFTAYFHTAEKVYTCMAWVESKEQMMSMIDEKFKGINRMDFAYCETNLVQGDVPKQEPILLVDESDFKK